MNVIVIYIENKSNHGGLEAALILTMAKLIILILSKRNNAVV